MMANEKKKDIMEKVKKLLAMAERKDGNENEAAVAATQASKLLAKYNLSVADVTIDGVIEVEYITNTRAAIPQKWIPNLVNSVALNFGCSMFTKIEYDPVKRNRVQKLILVGSEVDLQVASYVASYLQGVVKRMTIKYSTPIPKERRRFEGESYRLGLIRSIREKLRAFNKQQEKETANDTNVAGMTGTEIVLVKKDMLEKYLNGLNLKAGNKGRGRSISSSCYEQGAVDGKKVSIHRGVNGGQNQKSIAG